MQDFQFCDEKALSLFSFNVGGFITGVFSCLISKLLYPFILQVASPGCWNLTRRCQNLLDHPVPQLLTLTLALAGLATHAYLLKQTYGSLMNCAPWHKNVFGSNATPEWIIATINWFFMIQLMFSWPAQYYKVRIHETIIDVWMFTSTILGLVYGQFSYGFQFLVVQRLLRRPCQFALKRIFKRIFGEQHTEFIMAVFRLLIIIVLIAGLFHTAEEWRTNHNYNIDKDGELATVRTHDDYVYFTIVTLSTVGYGDISPKTVIGQVVVLIAVIITIGYFAMKFSDIKDWLSGIYNSVRYARKKLTPASRVVITGKLNSHNLDKFLADMLHKDRRNTHLDVVVLGEDAPDRPLRMIVSKYWNVRYCIGDLQRNEHMTSLFGRESRSHDTLVMMVDPSDSERHSQDNQIYQCIQRVKILKPNVRIVSNVFSKDCAKDLREGTFWNEELDSVVCLAEVTQCLLVQNVQAPGSAALMNNLLIASDKKYKKQRLRLLSRMDKTDRELEDPVKSLFQSYMMGSSLKIYQTHSTFKESIDFTEAAASMYLHNLILIGFKSDHEIEILPFTIPAGCYGLVIAENKNRVDTFPLTFGRMQKINVPIKTVPFFDENDGVTVLKCVGEDGNPGNVVEEDVVHQLLAQFPAAQVLKVPESRWNEVVERLPRCNSLMVLDRRETNDVDINDVGTIRIVRPIVNRLKYHQSDVMLTFELHEVKSLTSLLNPMIRKYFDDQPHGLGNLVSEQFSFAMLSCALSCPLMFRTVMGLMQGNHQSPRFQALRVTRDCDYSDCFLSLIHEGTLLLGVYKRFMKKETERVAVTHPVPSSQLGPDDVLIVLVRSKNYAQVENSVNPSSEAVEEEDLGSRGDETQERPVEESTEGALIQSGVGMKRLSLSEQITSENQLSDFLGRKTRQKRLLRS